MRGNLYLNVEVYAGSDCHEAIHEMASLASHMRITVSAKMNGVTVSAQPFCDSNALCDAWDAEMQTPGRPYKHVCGRTVPMGWNATSERGVES